MSTAPGRLEVNATRVHGAVVVRVLGDVDLRTSPKLRILLLESARALAGPLLLDLAGVHHMDSSGVGTIVYVKREVERAGGRLVLANLRPRVRSVLEITHLDRFFTIFTTVEEALAS